MTLELLFFSIGLAMVLVGILLAVCYISTPEMFRRMPDVRNGEYEERRSFLPRIVSGRFIWFKKYRRTFVSSMAGGFISNWLPDETEKQHRYCAFFGPCHNRLK